MPSVASASLRSDVRVTPGVLFRLSAVASAVAVGLVVVSAVLELGTTHWGMALVALPLLVANLVLARLAYPALERRAVLALVGIARRDCARRRRCVERRRHLGGRSPRRRRCGGARPRAGRRRRRISRGGDRRSRPLATT